MCVTGRPSELLGLTPIARETVIVHLRKPEGFTHHPGQTISLALPAPSGRAGVAQHIFSLASAPYEDHLCIATRMRAGSDYKRTLRALPTGSPVFVSGPYGYFTPPDSPRPLVFIAGGIGIAPIRGILRDHTHTLQHRAPRLLLYSNRALEDTAFLAEFQQLSQQDQNFQLCLILTGAPSTTRLAGTNSTTGRVDTALLHETLATVENPLIYVAGPSAMTRDVQAALRASGVPDDAIHTESFYGY